VKAKLYKKKLKLTVSRSNAAIQIERGLSWLSCTELHGRRRHELG